jgi:hypothetical protein
VSALLACKTSDKQQSQSQGVSAPIAAASNEVSFKRMVPKAGTKSTVSRKSTTKFTMSGKVYRETSVLDAAWEVKASDEFRITKASIDVKELFKTSQEGTGTEKKSVSPISGSSYVVTRYDDGTLGAQDSNGNKVAASLVKLIKEEFGSSFEKNQDAAFIPDRPVKLEEKLVPSSDVMLGMLGIKDDGNSLVDGTEFFLKSSTGSRATFDASMTMTQKVGSGMRVRAKLKGKFELQPEGAWLVAVDLTGPLTILDGTGKEKGTGDLTFVATQTFTQ